MKNLYLITLIALSACNPQDIDSKSEDAASKSASSQDDCSVPEDLLVDNRVVEAWDGTGNSGNRIVLVQYDISFDRIVDFLESKGLKVQVEKGASGVVANYPSDDYDVLVEKRNELYCFMDGEGPYNCTNNSNAVISFHGNEAESYLDKCWSK